jgi:phosphatidylinositol alpha-1,6-mannosyltransferase
VEQSSVAAIPSAVAPPRKSGQVLLLSELFPPTVGGSAVLFHGIYSRLRDANVLVLTDGASTDRHGEARGKLTVFKRPLATTQWGLFNPSALLHHLGIAFQLRMHTSRRGVVHCARALPEGVAALLARATGGPRYVCWAHGEDLTTALASREFTLLTRLVYRWAAAALANSHNTAAILASLGVPKNKIHVIYPAVDAERFHPDVDGGRVRRRYARDGDVVLLSVGRLQRRKGHDVAIRAVAALRDELPGLRYVIAGDGAERARLERLVADNNVADRVFFVGVVSDNDLPSYYAASDIFLHPNRVDDGDIEGFGIVFLEAAASGKPVIGGDSGGVPEAVERDVTGLLVDGADVDAVAEAIRDLATSESRRRDMGLAGRRRAVDSFSWQRAAAVVSELQHRIAAR